MVLPPRFIAFILENPHFPPNNKPLRLSAYEERPDDPDENTSKKSTLKERSKQTADEEEKKADESSNVSGGMNDDDDFVPQAPPDNTPHENSDHPPNQHTMSFPTTRDSISSFSSPISAEKTPAARCNNHDIRAIA